MDKLSKDDNLIYYSSLLIAEIDKIEKNLVEAIKLLDESSETKYSPNLKFILSMKNKFIAKTIDAEYP